MNPEDDEHQEDNNNIVFNAAPLIFAAINIPLSGPFGPVIPGAAVGAVGASMFFHYLTGEYATERSSGVVCLAIGVAAGATIGLSMCQ